MILFSKIKWQNFLSTGDMPNEIDLSSSRSTLIVGANGSGKSTLLDALSFALFGKPHRDINKAQLVNSINQKNCLVEVEFSIGKTQYRVVRGARPNVFEIWQDKVLLNQESHSRDYQKVLESNILKLNYKSFHQVVVLGSSSFIPFMQLPQWTRREVVEDLLDINVFTKMNVLLKEKAAKLRDTISATEGHLNLIKEKITLQNTHIDALTKIDQGKQAEIQTEIDTLTAEIAEKQTEATTYQSTINANVKTVMVAKLAAQKKRQTLVGYQAQIQSNLDRIHTESEFYQKNDECPTCQQKIEQTIKDRRAHQCSTQSQELNDGLTKLNDAMNAADAELQLADAAVNKMIQVQSSLAATNASIRSLELQIAALNKKLASANQTTDTSSAQELLNQLRAERDSLSDLRATQLDIRTYNEILSELLKDTGIKTKVIRQYLPIMNKFVNQYLNVLDFFVSFTLNESFEEKIRSRHRDDFSYASFSEGEKQRIDLALLFTWRQVAKMKNSISTNLLILDETFDSSMDTDGVDNLMKILNTLGTETNVFVISHKQDLLDGKFPTKITFQKLNNFSKIA